MTYDSRIDSQGSQSESPNLGIQRRSQNPAKAEGFRDRILSVAVDASNDKGRLVFGEELPALVGLFGKVDDKYEACQSDHACNDTLHDKDPSPSGNVGQTTHFGEGKTQDTAQG